ncbi:tRNA uridine-5-carboxymethylaminomethyl(34) synthesis GTPase MnmE [Gammaproteobacteria bacterium]|nr:tRNA uridine-5-carboxymethylaminomethyl(34) synthesis GTPase MnmE [Gammaproteobacteria bacterium]MDB2411578.1 tRNA uridine-5-carboxymethylaminomethyl(34) synthesis GTPase MnmE [Gammaproteobacteria bacterium]
MIFALATPIAQSAIAVFRLSGVGCCDVFNGVLKKPISKYREVFLRDVFWGGALIDRCSVVFYSGPHSYTGEDSVEVFCHGGLSVIKSLTGVFLGLGFREAEPGEFSRMAFENGKLSLNEVEAVADLIYSEDVERGLLSSEAVAGKLSDIISSLGEEVDELRVFVEGSIDFSDEDYDFILEGGVEERLKKIQSSLIDLIDASLVSTKKLSKNRVLFLGPPNTGKSSLFNRLLGFERALVSSVPGTTRDLIDSEMFYNSINMELVDSAGVRDTDDLVEAEGVALSGNEIPESALVLIVLDHVTESLAGVFKSMVIGKNHLMVFNKSDEKNPVEDYDCVVSAKSGSGIQELKKMVFNSIQQGKNSSKKTFIIRERHLALFNAALSSLDACMEKILNERDVDVAAEDLKLVRSSFDEFLGIKYPDELLGDIFNDFCIGK